MIFALPLFCLIKVSSIEVAKWLALLTWDHKVSGSNAGKLNQCIMQVRILLVIRCFSLYFVLQNHTATVVINPCPAEPGYTLLLQTVYIQISWLLKKPTDLDLHCFSFSMIKLSTTWIKLSDWLNIGSGILTYSA